MRDLIVLSIYLLVLSFIGVADAQTHRHYVQPDFYSFGTRLQRFGPEEVRMIGIGQNEWFFGVSNIYHYYLDGDGGAIPGGILEGISGEYAWDLTTMNLADGSFLVLTLMTGCDFGLPPQLAYYDNAGQLLWYLELWSVYTYSDLSLSIISDSVIVAGDPQVKAYVDFEGNRLPDQVSTGYHNQLCLDTGFLCSRENTFEILDNNFNTIVSREFSSNVQAFDTIAGGGYVVITDSIYVLDNQFEIQARKRQEGSYRWVVSSNSGFYLFPGGEMAVKLHPDLQTDSIYQIGFDCDVTDVLHIGDRVYISGTHLSEHRRGMFCIETDAATFLERPSPDLGIIDITFGDTIRYRPAIWGGPVSQPFYEIEYQDIYVTLVNEGEVGIDEGYVKFDQSYCPGICQGNYQFSWKIDDLNLEPGDTVTRFLTNLSLECAYFSPYNFCLFVAGPDDRPDANSSNDFYCAEIELITGIGESPGDYEVTIYPNPAVNEIFVRVVGDISRASETRLSVFGNNGVKLKTLILDGELTEVDMTNEPPGMYFFVLNDGKSFPVIRKVVMF